MRAAVERELARSRAVTMNADRAAVSRGEIVGGHYRLERILAEGGMGVVWAARDLRLGRSLAIKFLGLRALANPVQRERFAREAQLASKIRSPHVVQIIGDGMTDSGVPFVVMELLDGECLAAFLAREGSCSLATCGAVVEQVCRALSSAHSLGLVHRDIKPANIFLTPQPGGDVFVRLLDFGIAKELHFGPSGLTRSGELLGSTDYMSPEQFRKPEAVSAATDIWSLGVVVYEMLTGHLPFDESSFPSLAVRVAPGSFPPPSAVCPGLPPAIDAVVLKALAIHPSQRYATVDEFGAAFLRVVRAHISVSVVRADIVRVFDDAELAPYALEEEARSADRPTLQVRGWAPFWGVALVALCGLVLIGSWLVLERVERGGASVEARSDRSTRKPTAAGAPVLATKAPLPPEAAEPARLPLPAANDALLEPPAPTQAGAAPASSATAVASEAAHAGDATASSIAAPESSVRAAAAASASVIAPASRAAAPERARGGAVPATRIDASVRAAGPRALAAPAPAPSGRASAPNASVRAAPAVDVSVTNLEERSRQREVRSLPLQPGAAAAVSDAESKYGF